MRRLRGGGGVAPRRWSAVSAVLGPLGLAVVLVGCATPSVDPAASSYQAAFHASRDVREDDGVPQTPPPFRIRQVTDDPGEPFSFNYGPLPPRRLTNVEADAVIARAITEHEMRKP